MLCAVAVTVFFHVVSAGSKNQPKMFHMLLETRKQRPRRPTARCRPWSIGYCRRRRPGRKNKKATAKVPSPFAIKLFELLSGDSVEFFPQTIRNCQSNSQQRQRPWLWNWFWNHNHTRVPKVGCDRGSIGDQGHGQQRNGQCQQEFCCIFHT